ncbi:ferritin-like protein [Mucilaginibacter oryzae]|uniref:Ferritin-like protein n=1 Tax=Mucilaginibacter oryzae TaxID=468058 RepID=A0A316H9H7_9SPHI|nr:ferritin-like domain-containing protein [Mucilaginibacter oryzae]PWK76670.1 ferritin-like protein [Mucilaginibacter oryzae]
MNLFNIVEELEKVDPELNDRLNPRRAAIKNITSFGSKVALAAVPFALGTMLKRAYGATATTSVVDVLNYALTLEYLESSFYNQGAASAGLIPASGTAYINTVKDDENQHVAFLKTAITQSGGTPVTSPKFDFTAGGGTGNGPFKGVFSDYSLFLKVALAFEDTGVRAYKGQAPNLLGNKDILTAALSIHAVEARHASAIRQLLGVSPWITSTATLGNDTGISLVNGNYAGEETIKQGGVDLTTLPSVTASTTSVAVATAAFDEPLSKDQVLELLVGTFIYS